MSEAGYTRCVGQRHIGWHFRLWLWWTMDTTNIRTQTRWIDQATRVTGYSSRDWNIILCVCVIVLHTKGHAWRSYILAVWQPQFWLLLLLLLVMLLQTKKKKKKHYFIWRGAHTRIHEHNWPPRVTAADWLTDSFTQLNSTHYAKPNLRRRRMQDIGERATAYWGSDPSTREASSIEPLGSPHIVSHQCIYLIFYLYNNNNNNIHRATPATSH